MGRGSSNDPRLLSRLPAPRDQRVTGRRPAVFRLQSFRCSTAAAESIGDPLVNLQPLPSAAAATETEAEADRYLEQAATAADTRLSQSMERRRGPAPAEHSVAELDVLAAHARQRLALYRRRIYLGRGQATELAELERISAGAQERAQRARRGGRASLESPSQPKETT
jgi:uncharacterized protein HemY